MFSTLVNTLPQDFLGGVFDFSVLGRVKRDDSNPQCPSNILSDEEPYLGQEDECLECVNGDE